MMETKALLLTDVADSTRLAEAMGEAATAALWTFHDRLARDLLPTWRGREIDKTDGMLLLFDTAADAVGYALAYQRALRSLRPPLNARVGVHVGPIALRANRAADIARGAKPLEVDGAAKAVAARVMTVAAGGQILMSGAARRALPDEGFRLRSHGHWRLKGVAEPVELFEAGDEAAAFMPPSDAEKAYRVARQGDLWVPVREVRHNLAPERDSFVGREAELRALADAFEAGARLVTVVGPGGTGKTRLARRYAAAWLGEWPGGVYFCDLSEAHDLSGVQLAVALALGVPLVKGDASAQLGHAIAGRGRCLVILDNFEQVQAHAHATVGTWLDMTRDARFVVTSRERLHLAGEVVAELDPLPPGDDAIALFAARARAQQPHFAVDEGNLAAVSEIVRLLDGLPLAIELAAARVRVLSPAQILARMQDRFALLTGARGVAARQATLKAAIDWSWDLLAPWERSALAQCSVFDGGFTLEAAEAVVGLNDWPDAPNVLDAVQALVDKSLLRAWHPNAARRLDIAEPFFGMYLSIHEYAAQKLLAFGDRLVADTQQRHASYFAGFGSDAAIDALLRDGGANRRRTLALELDNLVSACRRAIGRHQADLAASCFLAAWAVLEAQGPYGLASELGLQVAALDGLGPHRAALVHSALAQALRSQGDIARSEGVLACALTLAQAADDRRALAIASREWAVARHRDGRIEEAQRGFDTALAVHEALNDRAQLGALRANFANLQMELGHMAAAQDSYHEAIALHREVGNRAAEGIAIGNLGTLHHELGRLDEAHAAYDEALRIHRKTGSLLQEAITLCNLGVLVAQRGDPGGAAAHYRDALTIHRETGNRRGEGVVLGQIGQLRQAAGEFDLARQHYDAALRIHREVGNRRFEGGVLGDLGALLADQGDSEAGMHALCEGEAALREVDDPLDLAKLLCAKGKAALSGGDVPAARAALDEARAIGERLGVEANSDLGRQVSALQVRLEGV
jgi:predicted ATPase/class 3 adenylate cyclase/Tfp pilus assembly protein PilF